jgi:uncharacterized MAPEG superfamily protein
MKVESVATASHPQSNKSATFTPHGTALIAMWLITTIPLVIMLFKGVRSSGQFQVERYILQSAYVLTLFWYLIRSGQPLKPTSEPSPDTPQKGMIRKLIPVLVIALVFVSEFYDQGIKIPMMMIAAIWIMVAWRREIRWHTILLGIVATVIALLAGLPFYQNQYIDSAGFLLLLIFVVPMFASGNLLSKRTGLRGSQGYAGRYKEAGINFLWGCLLFIPLGLTNAAAGSPGPWMTWVTRWWIPLTQPLFSGIVEEATHRLFLVSFVYFLLRPAFSKRPTIALVCAVLFSAITFGLGHGGTLQEDILVTGLLYGLPMAVTFVRRDWEYAIGAHYMINMIPTLIVLLET